MPETDGTRTADPAGYGVLRTSPKKVGCLAGELATVPDGGRVSTQDGHDERDRNEAKILLILAEAVEFRGDRTGFMQDCPEDRADWSPKNAERRVLYRLPELLAAPIVFLVQEEEDVETLRSHGFVATTDAAGAGAKWLDSYTTALAGKEVILIPDNDEPGRQRVLTIARALQGHAARLIVVELRDRKREVKDITDWFEQGHSEVELISLVEG